ncbi:MAG: hypothetical protein WKF55_13215 [Gemmatimonadaceae bacterium]
MTASLPLPAANCATDSAAGFAGGADEQDKEPASVNARHIWRFIALGKYQRAPSRTSGQIPETSFEGMGGHCFEFSAYLTLLQNA